MAYSVSTASQSRVFIYQSLPFLNYFLKKSIPVWPYDSNASIVYPRREIVTKDSKALQWGLSCHSQTVSIYLQSHVTYNCLTSLKFLYVISLSYVPLYMSCQFFVSPTCPRPAFVRSHRAPVESIHWCWTKTLQEYLLQEYFSAVTAMGSPPPPHELLVAISRI